MQIINGGFGRHASASSGQLPVAKGNLNAYLQFGEYGLNLDCGEKKRIWCFYNILFSICLIHGILRQGWETISETFSWKMVPFILFYLLIYNSYALKKKHPKILVNKQWGLQIRSGNWFGSVFLAIQIMFLLPRLSYSHMCH